MDMDREINLNNGKIQRQTPFVIIDVNSINNSACWVNKYIIILYLKIVVNRD